MWKELVNRRLSVMQWETLGIQIANGINNMPNGSDNKTMNIENLDILTPNWLILRRNNDRCPTVHSKINNDQIETNSKMFKRWFCWLISYVPTLTELPKWHANVPIYKVRRNSICNTNMGLLVL